MLGFQDFWVGFVWFGVILAPIVCVAYGAVMWNRGGEEE
ncbi:symporter small accessory protein [Thalassobacillus sp. CUG 92003]